MHGCLLHGCLLQAGERTRPSAGAGTGETRSVRGLAAPAAAAARCCPTHLVQHRLHLLGRGARGCGTHQEGAASAAGRRQSGRDSGGGGGDKEAGGRPPGVNRRPRGHSRFLSEPAAGLPLPPALAAVIATRLRCCWDRRAAIRGCCTTARCCWGNRLATTPTEPLARTALVQVKAIDARRRRTGRG